jgi:hypothetical protein
VVEAEVDGVVVKMEEAMVVDGAVVMAAVAVDGMEVVTEVVTEGAEGAYGTAGSIHSSLVPCSMSRLAISVPHMILYSLVSCSSRLLIVCFNYILL